MRVLIDIGHPAHVHVFKRAIASLERHGHTVLVTSRMKECATDLLDELGIAHRCLSIQNGGGLLGMGKELILRNLALIRICRDFRPDVLTGVGGIFVAQVGRLLGIPSVVFYDTENAKLQNLLTYPLASRLVVPACYTGWTPAKRTFRYSGFHEMAYLRKEHFTPCRDTAIRNGLAADRPTFLVRCVSWQANHDIGEQGWSEELLQQLVRHLAGLGHVVISSETALPHKLESLRYSGAPNALHHLMAFSALYVGESATMASECAVLGTPALYAAQTGRSYITQLQDEFGLARHESQLDWPSIRGHIDALLALAPEVLEGRLATLRDRTEDTSAVILEHLNAVLPLPAPGSQTSP